MVAHHTVGTGIDDASGFVALPGIWCEHMFGTPVQTDNDVAVGIPLSECGDAAEQRVERLLAYAGPVGQINVVFESQPQ